MLDPAARAEFERQYRLVLVIYSAMLASIFIYLGIGFLLARSSHLVDRSTRSTVGAVYGMAAILLGLILWLRKARISSLTHRSPAPKDMLELISRYRTGHIVAFVLCELITILGLLLLFLSGSFTHLVFLASLSFIVMIISYPKPLE